MERTNPNTPKYAVSVTHHGLHLLYMALDLAMSIVQDDRAAYEQLIEMFARNVDSTQARVTSSIVTRRALTEAHREAVKVDGHGTEFISQPLAGEEFADSMSRFDATLRKYDAAIAASIEKEQIDENEQGKKEGNLV